MPSASCASSRRTGTARSCPTSDSWRSCARIPSSPVSWTAFPGTRASDEPPRPRHRHRSVGPAARRARDPAGGAPRLAQAAPRGRLLAASARPPRRAQPARPGRCRRPRRILRAAREGRAAGAARARDHRHRQAHVRLGVHPGRGRDHGLEATLAARARWPCLTTSALTGSVYGGATGMALACDLRIGRDGLRMFMPAARFGLHYYPGGLRRYLDRLGLGATAKLMLTGMTIESAEMLRIGFLTESVPAEDFHTRMGEILEAVAQTDPATVARRTAPLLELLAGGRRAETQAVLEAMARAQVESRDSEELQRRLAARLGR